MDMTEKKISSRDVYHGCIVDVHMDEVSLPNGKRSQREVVEHPGGVCILPLDDQMRVITVTQYRYVFEKNLLELPAGKLDRDSEDQLEAAKRELSEETGLEAAKWTYLGYTLASPGFCDEALHMYLARDLTRTGQHLDEDEFLDVVTMPFDQLLEQVMDGTITDAKTVAITLKVKVLLGL